MLYTTCGYAQTFLDSTKIASSPVPFSSANVTVPALAASLGFDHILSIYEWQGHFDASSYSIPAFSAAAPELNDYYVHLEGDVRIIGDPGNRQNNLTTTQANGLISGEVTAIRAIIAERASRTSYA